MFYGKSLYYNELVKQKQPSYLDLWYKKPLYGKVDTDFHFVLPKRSLMGRLNVRMVTLSGGGVISTDDNARLGSTYALNFVADAFNAMNLYMRNQQQKGRMRANSFFTPLQAHKGWEDINKMYEKLIQTIYDSFIDRYIFSQAGKLNRQIKTFDDYMRIFVGFLNMALGRGTAFTKAGFLSKNNCPRSVCGLAIEIAKEMDCSDDMKKHNKYFSDPQMGLYLETVTRFGFYVDMNAPWRLIANLESPAWHENKILKEIVDSYFEAGYNVQSVFDNYYDKPHETDIQNFKVIVMQFYNSLIEQVPTYSIPRVCREVHEAKAIFSLGRQPYAQDVKRRYITMKQVEKKYDESFWLRLYMQVRLKEMAIGLSSHQLKHEMRDIDQRYSVGGYDRALEHVVERLAYYSKHQMEKYLYLRKQGEIPLTNGQTPDIIL